MYHLSLIHILPNDEINRYMKMEKLLENKISRRFKVRRLEINDFGYLMEHLYGRDGICLLYTSFKYEQKVKLVNPKLYGRGYAIGDMGHTDYVLVADDIVAVQEK